VARTVTISLPPKLAREIDQAARAEGRTRSELFRAALQQYLERRRRWDKIFEYGRQLAERSGVTEEDLLESIMRDRRVRRARRS
jgi:predicted transcriptional regulator